MQTNPGPLTTWLLSLYLCLLTANSFAAAPAVRVEVQTVGNALIKEPVQLTGTVVANRASSLTPATGGLITSMSVDAGSAVEPGQVLLQLDPELARWQAQNAQAAVRAATIALEDARRRLAEARALAPQQSIAETLVHELAAEVAGDESALQQANAEAGYREALLQRHELRAPYRGVIAAKLAEVGEWVVPGDAVFELVATHDLRIDFPIAEQYLGRVAPGTPIEFSAGSAKQGTHSGTIETVVPVTDPEVRTFLLRVDAGDDESDLSPGMSVHGRLFLDAGRRAVVVPRDAIIRYPDGRVIVWVVEEAEGGHLVAERVVTTGLAFEGLIEIRSGLAPGERIVVRGNEALKGGQAVTLLESSAD